jgi:hypothetical protein
MTKLEKFIDKVISLLDLDQKIELLEEFNNEAYDSKLFTDFINELKNS